MLVSDPFWIVPQHQQIEKESKTFLNGQVFFFLYLAQVATHPKGLVFLEANDGALVAAPLGDIARARGMTEIAKSAGITREALYKALRPESAPRFDTISRVCEALGVRLVAQPIDA